MTGIVGLVDFVLAADIVDSADYLVGFLSVELVQVKHTAGTLGSYCSQCYINGRLVHFDFLVADYGPV